MFAYMYVQVKAYFIEFKHARKGIFSQIKMCFACEIIQMPVIIRLICVDKKLQRSDEIWLC